MLESSALIQTLAEQNTQLVQRAERGEGVGGCGGFADVAVVMFGCAALR
jgi:hypothetical protein